MRRIENDCVDCGLPCIDSCRYKNAVHFYCDECGDERELYHYNDRELCEFCVLEELEKVEESWS